MMPVKLFDISKPPRAPMTGIYGPVGVGKTTLLETIPGRFVYIDVPTLEEGGYVIGDSSERIIAVRCEEWEDIEDIYWALKKRDETQLPGIGKRNDPDRVRSFALDSVSGMHTLAIRKIIRERDRSLGEQPHQITLQERGWISQLEAEMIFRFRSLDEYWQYFVAQERMHGGMDDDPSPKQIGPDLPGGSLRAFKQAAFIVARLDVVLKANGKEERQLRVGPAGGEYIVKARGRKAKKLPNVIRDPNLAGIYRYIFGDGPRPKEARDNVF
jgi:hypothetical protein